jgi:hypothetical protein
MENLGHVRVKTMRDFIEKNKDYFSQRKIRTLKKQEAINVIEKKFNEGNVPSNIMKEWERITVKPKTIRGLKSSKSPMGSVPPPRKRRGKKPEEAKPPSRLIKLEKMSIKPMSRLQKLERQTISEGIPPPSRRKKK